MRIENTIPEFNNRFLRRMVSWCCRQLELPVKKLAGAKFRNRGDGFTGGHAKIWSRKILISSGVSIWREGCTPDAAAKAVARKVRIRELVRVTGHEVAHIEQSWRAARRNFRGRLVHRRRPIDGGSEFDTQRYERRIMQAFLAEEAGLVSKWEAGTAQEQPEPADAARSRLVERRAENAQKLLAAWQRKVKLAASKVRKYKKRVAYYQRRQNLATAACSPAKG